jgi:hypothetical protein
MRRYRFLGLLLAAPLLLAVPAPASAAVVPSIDVTAATLLANGAGVQLELTGTCDVGESGVFSATVTQSTGRHVAQGTGFTVVTCTGEPQQATVIVAADVTGVAFRTGDALVDASLIFGCCTGVSTQEVIRLRR